MTCNLGHATIKTDIYVKFSMACIARTDFAELYVFLGQNILLTLEQHFNPKCLSWSFPYT